MTSLTSIFGCAAADVTVDRVRQLVDQALPESLTLEYKERFSSKIVDSVAAMANSYGGVILVGVTDQRALVGVGEDTVVQIVNACHWSLEPPWQPEIIPLPLPGTDGKLVLVVRIDPSRAPRPVLVRGAAPVRLHGRNAVADRTRLARLFAESAGMTRGVDRVLRLTGSPGGSQDAFDFAIRSGLVLPVDDSATWRPLSDRGIDALATALDGSRVGAVLLAWRGRLGIEGVNPFFRSGLNRARTARLVWQAVADIEGTVLHPVKAIAALTLPEPYGLPSSGLTFTLDVVVRARAFLAALPDGSQPAPDHWLTVPQLYGLCDALLTTLTDAKVAAHLADFAGIDPVLVPQPANLDFVTSPDVSQLLDLSGLKPVPDAGASHGAEQTAAEGGRDREAAGDRSWLRADGDLVPGEHVDHLVVVVQRLQELIRAIGAQHRVPPWWVRKRREQLGVRRPPASRPRPAAGCAPRTPSLVAALNGRFDDHHGELARMLLDQIDTLTTQIDKLTRWGPFRPRPGLGQATGTGRRVGDAHRRASSWPPWLRPRRRPPAIDVYYISEAELAEQSFDLRRGIPATRSTAFTWWTDVPKAAAVWAIEQPPATYRRRTSSSAGRAAALTRQGDGQPWMRITRRTVEAGNPSLSAISATPNPSSSSIAALPPSPQPGDHPAGHPNDRPTAGLPVLARLAEIPGLSERSAQVIVAELGLDMTRFPTAGHLASWAKLTPRTIQSGAQLRNGKTGKGNPYLKGVLGEAAAAAAKTDTFLGEKYRRIVKRRGKLKALVAVARSIVEIVWHLLADPTARFHDLGADYHTTHLNQNKKIRNHVRQLQALGFTVTLEHAAA